MTVKFACFKEDYPFFETLLFQQQYNERPEVDTVHLNIVENGEVVETKVYYIQEVNFNRIHFYAYVDVDYKS